MDSDEGARLLCLAEYHTHGELASMLRIAKRQDSEDGPATATKLVIAYSNGSVATMAPLENGVFKRLHLLQSQLLRNSQHVAGLNPKMHRFIWFLVVKGLRSDLTLPERLSIIHRDGLSRK